jgi:hypothetical protein
MALSAVLTRFSSETIFCLKSSTVKISAAITWVVNKPIINMLPIAVNANLNFMVPLLIEVKNITDIVEKRYRNSRSPFEKSLDIDYASVAGIVYFW